MMVVSMPIEPSPVLATVYPLRLRYCCRALICGCSWPGWRSTVKRVFWVVTVSGVLTGVVTAGFGVLTTGAGLEATARLSATLVFSPTMPV